MATIPFVPGAVAGALLWRQNCNQAAGAIGCIPQAPVGNRDWIGFCSKSDFGVEITTEFDDIDAINSCVYLPPERETTGAIGTITACRVQDAALLELVAGGTPIVWDDPLLAPTFLPTDEVGYKLAEFGSTQCTTCGSGCDQFSLILWSCAVPLRGCATALPPGIFSVLVLPSFKLSPPETLKYGGGRKDFAEDDFDVTMQMFNITGNTQFAPCVLPAVTAPIQRGPQFAPAATPLVPDLAGLEGSPLAVFLTDQAPPVGCDCCGEAGFWDGDTNGPLAIVEEPGGMVAAVTNSAVDAGAVIAELEAATAGQTDEQKAADVKARVDAEKAKR